MTQEDSHKGTKKDFLGGIGSDIINIYTATPEDSLCKCFSPINQHFREEKKTNRDFFLPFTRPDSTETDQDPDW